MATYSYLDSLVWLAYRVANLDYDDLPPLRDTDTTEYLKLKAFKVCYNLIESNVLMS